MGEIIISHSPASTKWLALLNGLLGNY